MKETWYMVRVFEVTPAGGVIVLEETFIEPKPDDALAAARKWAQEAVDGYRKGLPRTEYQYQINKGEWTTIEGVFAKVKNA